MNPAWRALARVALSAAAGLVGAMLAGCCAGLLTLQAPTIAPSSSREPTPVELEPIAVGGAMQGAFMPPGPAAVLTSAMNAELAGRALHGGEAGGYAVGCKLDRFTLRTREWVTSSEEMVLLYVDLSCEAKRALDGARVWRGELRGRSCAASSNVLGSDSTATARLADRVLSDAAREMASDLALRALALAAEPSARVFADERQQRDLPGLDDVPVGRAALDEDPSEAERAIHATTQPGANPRTLERAAAWNVAAMASGPGDAWVAGDTLTLDEQPLVRFAQYKALARLGTPASLRELAGAAQGEDNSLLLEMLNDSLRSGGIGLARSRRTQAP